MNTYAFTDAAGQVQVLLECPQEQIDIQPYNTQYPLRFDVTGQLDAAAQTASLAVDFATGLVYEVEPPAPPAPTPEELAQAAVSQRNDLLAGCDWTQLPDVPAPTAELWAPYRQALRDITDQPGFPDNIIWPTPPQ